MSGFSRISLTRVGIPPAGDPPPGHPPPPPLCRSSEGAGLQQYKCRHHCANYPDRLRGLAKVTGPTGQGNSGRCRVRLHRLGSLACAGNGKWGMENGKCLVEQNGQIRGERERHKTCAE